MFPHREPPFQAGWWSIDRLVPILLMLLLIGVLVWVVVRFTRQPKAWASEMVAPRPGISSPSVTVDPAVEEARLRYGRGELDRDTFLQIVGDLSSSGVESGAADQPPPPATS